MYDFNPPLPAPLTDTIKLLEKKNPKTPSKFRAQQKVDLLEMIKKAIRKLRIRGG